MQAFLASSQARCGGLGANLDITAILLRRTEQHHVWLEHSIVSP